MTGDQPFAHDSFYATLTDAIQVESISFAPRLARKTSLMHNRSAIDAEGYAPKCPQKARLVVECNFHSEPLRRFKPHSVTCRNTNFVAFTDTACSAQHR